MPKSDENITKKKVKKATNIPHEYKPHLFFFLNFTFKEKKINLSEVEFICNKMYPLKIWTNTYTLQYPTVITTIEKQNPFVASKVPSSPSAPHH